MPTNFLSIDAAFPSIEDKTQDEINREMLNYLYMLLEQLRYTLSNLGINNFNESELGALGEMATTGYSTVTITV